MRGVGLSELLGGGPRSRGGGNETRLECGRWIQVSRVWWEVITKVEA